ncbi:MAG TPA: hypothetical protein VGM88_28250 [Kofleriaceae bacterium]|jgi:hypothetical protein
MGFQFAETMAGTVTWDDRPGVAHPFKFEVTAQAESTRAHVKDGKADLHGTIYVPPLTDAAEAHGTITIRPFGERIIRYELVFTGDDGNEYELIGQKDIRWTSPIHSWTHLPAEIRRAGGPRIATCDTRFDIRPANTWRFLRSFRPL